MWLMLIKKAYQFSILDPAVENEHQIFQIRYQHTLSQRTNVLIYLVDEDSPNVHRLNKMFLFFYWIILYSLIKQSNLSGCHRTGTEHWGKVRSYYGRTICPQILPHFSILKHWLCLFLLIHEYPHIFAAHPICMINLFLHYLNLVWPLIFYMGEIWQMLYYTTSRSRC